MPGGYRDHRAHASQNLRPDRAFGSRLLQLCAGIEGLAPGKHQVNQTSDKAVASLESRPVNARRTLLFGEDGGIMRVLGHVLCPSIE
jgi:hypothetical protein